MRWAAAIVLALLGCEQKRAFSEPKPWEVRATDFNVIEFERAAEITRLNCDDYFGTRECAGIIHGLVGSVPVSYGCNQYHCWWGSK